MIPPDEASLTGYHGAYVFVNCGNCRDCEVVETLAEAQKWAAEHDCPA